MAQDLELALKVKADVNQALRSLDQLEREIKGQGSAAGVTRRNVGGLGTGYAQLAAAAGAYLSVATLMRGIRIADEFRQLETRVRLATEAQGDFNRVWRDLGQLSQRNGSALRDTVSLFQGINRAAPDIGATRDQVLAVTNAVQQLGAISGASGSAMSNAMLQFSQAMAGGVVRAEEMNSIIENTPAIAEAIAQGMGLTVGQLRRAVAEGGVLSEQVFGALLSKAPEIAEQFAKVPVSLERAGAAFDTAMGLALTKLDKALRLSQTLAESISGWARIINAVAQQNPNGLQLLPDLRTDEARIVAMLRRLQELQEELRELERAASGDMGLIDRLFVHGNAETAEEKADAVRQRMARLREEVEKLIDQRNDRALAPPDAAAVTAPAQSLAKAEAETLTNIYKQQLDLLKKQAEAGRDIAARFKETRDALSAPADTLATGTVLEPINAIQAGRTALDAGDIEGAARAAEKARQQIAALGEEGKASTQFLNSLLDQAEAVATGANDAKTQALEEQTASVRETLDLLLEDAAKLEALQIGFDVEQAIAAANNVWEAIDAVIKRPHQTTISAAAAPADAPGFADGGLWAGPGTGTSDSILARVSAGEYTVRAAAVRKYGVGFLERLNRGALPRFAEGGLAVPGLGALPPPASAGGLEPTVININGKRFDLLTESGQGDALGRLLKREIERTGSR